MADWSIEEVDLIIRDYFSMLSDELAGRHYSKTEHRRHLIPLLSDRSNASVEFKNRNISAVLSEMGLPFIKGYTPSFNYQRLLLQRCEFFLQRNKNEMEPAFETFSNSVLSNVHVPDMSNLLDAPPDKQEELRNKSKIFVRNPFKINYLMREQQNQQIGKIGEDIVLQYERWRLTKEGHDTLADKVECVSEYDDAAGFDILSKNVDGSDRYIEVKTTKLSKESPIFFSNNEYEFSLHNSSVYYLYRVF